jgi:hypothetical protein
MKRKTKEYLYLDKLDINYFEEQIQLQVEYILEADGNPKYMLEELDKLWYQVAALRDVFYLFAGPVSMSRLKKPVENAIAEVKKNYNEEDDNYDNYNGGPSGTLWTETEN